MPKQQKKARANARGVVRVTIALENGDGERIKGNVIRTFKVSAATVTDVASAVEDVFVRPDLYQLRQ